MFDTSIRPSENQLLLFLSLQRELKERAYGSLSDEECTFIAANFAKNYDFGNSALYHKSVGGWAKMLLEKID